MYSFTDKMIIAMENPNVSTDKLLKSVYQISNFTGEFTCENQFYFYTSNKRIGYNTKYNDIKKTATRN